MGRCCVGGWPGGMRYVLDVIAGRPAIPARPGRSPMGRPACPRPRVSVIGFREITGGAVAVRHIACGGAGR
jgi:hypothetical protein